MRHDTDNIQIAGSEAATLESAISAQSTPAQRTDAGNVPATLVGALFDGLSSDDRAWVVDRINYYRALAAADQAPEGRF